MGVFEHFPYVNFHELNLSWIVNKLKELEDIIGSQIVDIVARAGVAANTQAIENLTTTVNENAVTAHTESSAAQATASNAETLATQAGTDITNLTNQVTKTVFGGQIGSNTTITVNTYNRRAFIFIFRQATNYFDCWTVDDWSMVNHVLGSDVDISISASANNRIDITSTRANSVDYIIISA